MTLPRPLAAAAGLLLFTLPFLQSGLGERGHDGACAMDHEPRHGGRLLMLGERHLELVERGGSFELYVSDLARRPIRPLSASVAFDDTAATELAWQWDRSVGTSPPGYRFAQLELRFDDSPPLSIRMPAPERLAHF